MSTTTVDRPVSSLAANRTGSARVASSWQERVSARRHRGHRGPGPAISLGLAILATWWAVTRAGLILPVFLPGPADVARRLWLGVSRADLLEYARVTLTEAALGCLAAAALSLPLAWALFHWRLFTRAVLPYVAASQAVPAVAIAPLLVVWIGYGTVPIVALCVLMVFFPITVTVLLGLRGLDTDVIDAARLDGAHGASMVVHMDDHGGQRPGHGPRLPAPERRYHRLVLHDRHPVRHGDDHPLVPARARAPQPRRGLAARAPCDLTTAHPCRPVHRRPFARPASRHSHASARPRRPCQPADRKDPR